MAVVTVHDVVYRKFSGFDEPQYPSGYWRGGGISVGDASGGDHALQIEFAKATGLRNSQYFSLEQLMITVAAGPFAANVQVSNMDIYGTVTAFIWVADLPAAEGNQAGLAGRGLAGFRKLWLGQQVTPDTVAALAITIDNTLNEIMIASAEGYVWSARSTAVPGGPQRPPTGLYG